jgi:thiamine-phosphate pyrophosphorylase
VQVREKSRDDRELLQYARAAVQVLENFGGHVVVNDRVDIALASGAAGVHVGQEDLTVDDVRKVAGARLAIGVSTHNVEQARAALQAGADNIGCGPSFPSQTKTFEQFAGVAYLKQVAQEIDLPSLAIGGIGLDNLDQVLATGVRAVAVSAAVHRASDPAAAVRALCERLEAAPATKK